MNAYIIPGVEIENTIRADIHCIVEDYFELPRYKIWKSTRIEKIVVARQIAMYFMRKYTRKTLHEIGEYFRKDHSTVVYACRMVQNMIETTDKYASDITRIESLINNHLSKNCYDGKAIDHPVKHRKGFFQEVSAPLAAGQ